MGGKRQNQRYFPPILRQAGGEIWVISPPFWDPLGGKFWIFPPQMGGKPYDFGADFPSHLGRNKGKCSILIVNLPFWYSVFQNFRLRRYLGIVFFIVIQNRACLRRFTITLRQFDNSMFDWRKIVVVLHHKHLLSKQLSATFTVTLRQFHHSIFNWRKILVVLRRRRPDLEPLMVNK